ncbi:MAG TPA: TRAP transporter small permease [Gammaproteobacteria bacterium]|jgi:TRAP-type C4-dicarboxylate transport system permease small subunit
MRIESAGRWLEDALLVGLFGVLTLVSVMQILLRNLGFAGFVWGDGLVRIGVLWIALLGAVAASRDQKHIAIDLARRLLPERFWRPVAVVVDAFTATVCGFLAYYSWSFVRDSRAFGDTVLGDWPAWLFQLILPVGFALISYRYASGCLRRIAGVKR